MKNRTLEQGRWWEPCKVCGLPCVVSESWSANGGAIAHGCANCVVQDRNRLHDALKEAEGVLRLCGTRDFPAPEDAEVKALGARIGFGALMSAASKTWADWLVEQGMPSGSNFASGPCVTTVERTLKTVRDALRKSLLWRGSDTPTGGTDI